LSSPVRTAPRLSVAIITKNEAHRIGRCLRSVAFAEEIVVVDSGSDDATQDIARRAGATVIETPDWPGFGPQKNRVRGGVGGDRTGTSPAKRTGGSGRRLVSGASRRRH
jgi:cellulose synthase/poly-beta-1,6-N-acetylglucosamine synthase-like glycosyltransferase